jgi:hypothetical protein
MEVLKQVMKAAQEDFAARKKFKLKGKNYKIKILQSTSNILFKI